MNNIFIWIKMKYDFKKNPIRLPPGSVPLELSTTNLEKSLEGLPPASNVSVGVRAYNGVGAGPASQPVFCTTQDQGRCSVGDDTQGFTRGELSLRMHLF